jgi:hypothetical protein
MKSFLKYFFALGLIYVFLEFVLYIYYFYNYNFGVFNFEAINKPNIVFDSIRGFRFTPGEAQTLLIKNGCI